LALLAEHAPDLSRVQTRQALREWVVDWNEMRVADPWDISHAIAPGAHAGARRFSKTARRLLSSLQDVANRCAFDRALADPEVDVDALVDKMRGVPAHARAVMKTTLSESGDWKPDKEISKLVQKLGLVPKTTSLAKVAAGLAAITDDADRVRAHYLLARCAHRPDDAPDPLSAAAKKATKKAAKKAPAKKASTKPTAKKAAKKAAKKTTTKKVAKKATKKVAKKTAKKTAKR